MNELETAPRRARTVWAIPLRAEAGNHLHIRMGAQSRLWSPPTDVYETADNVIVRVEIAGMQKSEFSILLEGNLLTIQGNRSDSARRRAFHQMEIPFGEFRSQVELHWEIDHAAVRAEYKDGFLVVTLPKAKPFTVEIGE